MSLRIPKFSRFFSKLFYDILPAAIASAIGAFLFGHAGSKPASPPPPTEISAPASANLLTTARDNPVKVAEPAKVETKPQPARAKAEARAADEHATAVREAEARPDIRFESKPESKPLSITIRSNDKAERIEKERAEHERIEKERAERKALVKPAPVAIAKASPVEKIAPVEKAAPIEKISPVEKPSPAEPSVSVVPAARETPPLREASTGEPLPPPSQPHPLGTLTIQPSVQPPVAQPAPMAQPAPVQQQASTQPQAPLSLSPLPVQTITELPRSAAPRPATMASVPPPPDDTARSSNSEGGVMGKMRDAAASVTGIFKGSPPPRPPGDLPHSGDDAM